MFFRFVLVCALVTGLGACGDNHKGVADAGAPGDAMMADTGPAPDAPLEGFTAPDIVCPGGPGCATDGDGVLKVGASAHAYTPMNFETYTDENNDKQWESDEPYTDLNGNGKFDGVWLFGGGRAAEGVTTDVEARALAFVEGDTTVVIVYIDCIGLLAGDMDAIRNHPMLAGLDIDHIIIGATHAHDAPDTVGLWGPSPTSTGREDFVIQALYDAAAASIYDAVTTARPAHMVIASTKLLNDPNDPLSRTDMWNGDFRDPVIFDPTLTIARFVDATDEDTTIGTLVNWADHPEVAHFSQTDPAQVTAHYPHWLRESIEQGVTTSESIFAQQDLAGLGGVTVFVQGAVGGQVGSLTTRNIHPPGPDGTPITVESNAEDEAIGKNVAARALTVLRDDGETVTSLPLSMVSAKYNARIDNTLFQLAFLVHLLGPHDLVGYNPDEPLDDTNAPWMPMRATYLQIGPLGIETVPGELHPELWVGGYDGSWTWGWVFNDDTKPNQPDFAHVPQPPYMRDLVLAHSGVRYPVLAGLAEDYCGYIVPAYNYALDPGDPYINEADGDHYEEVYSLGPDDERHVVDPILQLLQYH
ncbi:MAG TPA: hypothetical protein VGM88_05025 [Kofleriaceae bacterium]|jgi:hypothetical protein